MNFPFRKYVQVVIQLSYGVNGKACAEKYEDSYQARILMIFMIYFKNSSVKKDRESACA